MESAVEHFFNFGKICSTLEPARGGFGVGGRTFFQILEILFYLGARGQQNWTQEQTKFVCPGVRAFLANLPVTAGCILRVLIEQEIRSAAFDKKVIKIKKAGQNQSTCDPCSAFHFIRVRNGTYFPASDHLCKTLFNVYVITRKTK